MGPTVAELLASLPQDEPDAARLIASGPTSAARIAELFEQLSLRPAPVGAFSRFWSLGALQTKLALAYLTYYIRNWFRSPEKKTQQLLKTNLRAALCTLETMGYMRGAVMKVGQVLATFPEMLPDQFAELLGKLHFEAPPMHYSLIREQLENELGRDPQEVFASFDEEAFAAASLGQVHRARLKSGQEVAVKIQYPGIARTIRQDIRNLFFFMLPARLSRDWENIKEQFEDLRIRLERETDYEQEAAMQAKVRALFREDDDIVVPRVFPEHSTARVLTMDYLEGRTLDEFVATNPSQALRNEFARKILRAWYRMMYAGRLLYADIHPGNTLFLDDGR